MIDMIGPAHPAKLHAGEYVNKLPRSKPLIISAVGYARSGKDEFANIAVEEYGFTRFAFADKLRECLLALDPIIAAHEKIIAADGYPSITMRPVRLSEVIDQHGWNGYKETQHSDEIRALLQRMGTEVGRDLIDTDIWLKELDKVKADRIVITDTRFPNELDYVKAKGGKFVRIWRPGYGPVNDHISEVAIDSYTQKDEINNDGTLEEYQTQIRNFLDSVL